MGQLELWNDQVEKLERLDKEMDVQAAMLEKIVDRLTALEYYATASDVWGDGAPAVTAESKKRNSGDNQAV